MKTPLKKLDLSRSCYYELQAGTSMAELSQHEIYYRTHQKAVFRVRFGTMFIFELPTVERRDVFLKALEAGAKASGLRCVRTWFNPNQPST